MVNIPAQASTALTLKRTFVICAHRLRLFLASSAFFSVSSLRFLGRPFGLAASTWGGKAWHAFGWVAIKVGLGFIAHLAFQQASWNGHGMTENAQEEWPDGPP